MTKKHYSDSLLDEMFKVIDEKLDRIIEQTTKTNGRCTELERFQGMFKGALGVVMTIILPIALYIVYNHLG